MSNATTETESLTNFKRNTRRLVSQIRRTGQPVLLTVGGKAALVVQDADSYRLLLERAEAIEGIRRGLADVRHGRTQPLDEAFEEIRAKRRGKH